MLAGLGKIGLCGLRRPFSQISNSFYAIRELATRVESAKDQTTDTNSKKTVFFTNSREGDWVCPGCGVLSFSWRNVCFKCGSSKPSLANKAPSAVDAKSSRRGRTQQVQGKEEISLKELLIQGQKARDYGIVLKETEKILKQKKLIKSSVVATMIRVFGKSGNINRAVELFNDIGRHPFIVRRPTPYHYAATITACSENGKWETALDVFDHMRVNSRTKSIVVCSSAMSACNKAKQYNQVIRIFNTITTEGWVLDTVCYNIVLDSFVKIGNYSRAYELYEQMNSSKIKKDDRTYGVMLECCGRSGDWVLAQELLKQINLSRHIEINSVMYTSALMAYARGGEPEKGLELFEKLRTQTKLLVDYPLYSALLFTLAQLPPGRQSGIQSLEVLNEMTRRHIKLSVKVVTTVITCLDKDEMYDSAVSLYDMARANGMFAHCDPQIVFPSQASESESGQILQNESKKNSSEKPTDTERRIDFRNNSAPMVRVILRSIFRRVREADSPPVDDYLIILGKREREEEERTSSLSHLTQETPTRRWLLSWKMSSRRTSPRAIRFASSAWKEIACSDSPRTPSESGSERLNPLHQSPPPLTCPLTSSKLMLGTRGELSTTIPVILSMLRVTMMRALQRHSTTISTTPLSSSKQLQRTPRNLLVRRPGEERLNPRRGLGQEEGVAP
jgi:pentatricopeptide repeat protein